MVYYSLHTGCSLNSSFDSREVIKPIALNHFQNNCMVIIYFIIKEMYLQFLYCKKFKETILSVGL